MGQGVEILNFKKVVKEEKMRGKNKCTILKGGFVDVELDAATRLGSPWTSREGLLGTWLGVVEARCCRLLGSFGEQCGGKRG